MRTVYRLYNELARSINDDLILFSYNDTHEIESNHFTLAVVVHDTKLEIRNIEARGLFRGQEVVSVVHAVAKHEGLEVVASNVLDTAEGFWRQMGYEEIGGGAYILVQ